MKDDLCLSSLDAYGGQTSVQNCSACRIESSATQVTFQRAHRPALYIWRPRFRTFTIIQQKYVESKQKLYKITIM
jgi:hypothetical protein